MKIVLSFIAVFLLIVTSYSQSRTIGKDEYEKAFNFALTETNADYPHIFKVTTTFIENGKIVRTVTDVNENESPGHHRIKTTETADGRVINKYQITVGDNVYCSEDGVSWKPPQQYECDGPISMYGRREVESIEYGVNKKAVNSKKVRVYRKYTVFAPSKGSTTRKFQETVSTVDSRGFFLTVVDTEGTLDPKIVTLIREQSWITKAKIEPVAAPKSIQK